MIGAIAAETRISMNSDSVSRIAPPKPRRVLPSMSASAEPEEFRRQQDRHRQFEQMQRAHVVEHRPGREQRELGGEIFGPDVFRLQHQHEADDQLRHPERRGEIAHDAGDEMLARRQREARRSATR